MNKIKSRREKRFSVLLTIVMILIMVITVYPVWYSLINSLNSAQAIAKDCHAAARRIFPGELEIRAEKSGNIPGLRYHTLPDCDCHGGADSIYRHVCLWVFPGQSGGKEILHSAGVYQHVLKRRRYRLFYPVQRHAYLQQLLGVYPACAVRRLL